MKFRKRSYKGIDRVARSLGLVGESGLYVTPSGMNVDLTATAETREAILYTIGGLSLQAEVSKALSI